MSFSTTDIQMGADLVIKAIGEDVRGFLRTPSADDQRQSSAADTNRALQSLQALSRWQLENNILVMNQDDRSYSIDAEAIDKLPEAKVDEGVALYKSTVDTHLPIIGDLHRSGRTAYVDYFGENHRSVDGLIEPPISRPTEASMDTVTKSALAFVEAIDADSTKGSSLTGITRMDTEALTDTLADAGYLVPGENPQRTQPLAEQTSRGSYEQKLAIFEQASTIAANLELPDSVRGFDAPIMAAKALQASVTEAEIEERPVFGTGKVGGASIDSDLPVESVQAINMTMLLAAQIVANSQMSTDIEHNDTDEPMVVISQTFSTVDSDGKATTRNDLMATFRAHVHHDIETGIVGVIQRGARTGGEHDFYIPDLANNARETRDVARNLASFYKSAQALAGFEPDTEERIDGDSGARGLGGPHAAWEGADEVDTGADSGDNEFDREINLDEDNAQESDAPLRNTRKAEIATERFARKNGLDLEPAEMVVPEKIIERMAKTVDESVSMGLIQKMGRMTGRDAIHGANDAALFSGNRAASFGGYEDFMEGALAPEASEKDFARNVYSFGQVDRRGEAFGQRLAKQGAVRIDPDRGIFKETHYKPASPHKAARRVDSFIANNMQDEDGKPNLALRAMLRKMSGDRPIIAHTQEEAQAWKNNANAFVDRENEEHKLRLQAASEKAGVWSVDLPRKDLQRALTVAQASGDTDTPFHLKIDRDSVSLSRADAPLITASLGASTPETIRNANTKRSLGGMITINSMRGGLEAMGKDETVARAVIHGEVPKGITSEFQDKRQREAEATKAAKPRGLEPHLPDQLG